MKVIISYPKNGTKERDEIDRRQPAISILENSAFGLMAIAVFLAFSALRSLFSPLGPLYSLVLAGGSSFAIIYANHRFATLMWRTWSYKDQWNSTAPGIRAGICAVSIFLSVLQVGVDFIAAAQNASEYTNSTAIEQKRQMMTQLRADANQQQQDALKKMQEANTAADEMRKNTQTQAAEARTNAAVAGKPLTGEANARRVVNQGSSDADKMVKSAKTAYDESVKTAQGLMEQAKDIELDLKDDEASRYENVTFKQAALILLSVICLLLMHVSASYKYEAFALCKVTVRVEREDHDELENPISAFLNLVNRAFLSFASSSINSVNARIQVEPTKSLAIEEFTDNQVFEWSKLMGAKNVFGIKKDWPANISELSEKEVLGLRANIRKSLQTAVSDFNAMDDQSKKPSSLQFYERAAKILNNEE